MESTIGIALLGRGTVGGGVAALLESRRAHLERRSGAGYEIVGIGSRANDPVALVDDPRVDLVVETMGGLGIALECIERALEARKHVVTANKDALATQGPRLRALAAAKGVTLRYEAAVASAVPIITTLDGALAGDEIVEICGVVNGTCNFILGLMREGLSFAGALSRAQVAGYAEADPRNDVEGIDAAHKLAILMQHAFERAIVTRAVPHSGIGGVTTGAVRRARQHGYEIKLVAYARKTNAGIAAEVGPMLVPFAHPFAKIDGVQNILRVTGSACGPLTFSGAGAGREAAASAVLGDVVAALRAIAERHSVPRAGSVQASAAVVPAFENFPVFAGYPVLTQPLEKGDTHVGDSSRTLSAV